MCRTSVLQPACLQLSLREILQEEVRLMVHQAPCYLLLQLPFAHQLHFVAGIRLSLYRFPTAPAKVLTRINTCIAFAQVFATWIFPSIPACHSLHTRQSQNSQWVSPLHQRVISFTCLFCLLANPKRDHDYAYNLVNPQRSSVFTYPVPSLAAHRGVAALWTLAILIIVYSFGLFITRNLHWGPLLPGNQNVNPASASW